MLKITDIEPGQSYACKFKLTTLLDRNGKIPKDNTEVIENIGEYESLGIIAKRDLDKNLVELIDNDSGVKFIIPFTNIWDIDKIDWI